MKSEWSWSTYALPGFGEGLLLCRDRAVSLIRLPPVDREVDLPREMAQLLRGSVARAGFAAEAAAILEEAALRGDTVGCLPRTALHLGVFTEKVLLRCEGIPRGEVRTYAQLAREVGNPRGARAVGQAMAGNVLPLLIPCHRVVPSGGGVGGFAGGGEMKRWLLEREGALEPELLPL